MVRILGPSFHTTNNGIIMLFELSSIALLCCCCCKNIVCICFNDTVHMDVQWVHDSAQRRNSLPVWVIELYTQISKKSMESERFLCYRMRCWWVFRSIWIDVMASLSHFNNEEIIEFIYVIAKCYLGAFQMIDKKMCIFVLTAYDIHISRACQRLSSSCRYIWIGGLKMNRA